MPLLFVVFYYTLCFGQTIHTHTRLKNTIHTRTKGESNFALRSHGLSRSWMTQPRTNAASRLLRFSGLTGCHFPLSWNIHTKSPFTWLESCWLIGRMLSWMVVGYVTAHCDAHCVPDIRCRLVLQKTFPPVSISSLALKVGLLKSTVCLKSTFSKFWEYLTKESILNSYLVFLQKDEGARARGLKNPLSRMLCKWITWRQDRGLQKCFKKKIFSLRSREKEQRTKTKTEIIIYLSSSILHCPVLSSLFMKHTQDSDKRHWGNMATHRKWKELVQDWTQGEALFSGSRSDIKSLPSCTSAGRRLGPVRWR